MVFDFFSITLMASKWVIRGEAGFRGGIDSPNQFIFLYAKA